MVDEIHERSAGVSVSALFDRLIKKKENVHHLGGDDADADKGEDESRSRHDEFLPDNRIFVRV